MAFSGKLIDLKHFLITNTETLNQEGALNTLKVDSKMFEDEMFIGSVFCSDLSSSQKVMIHNQQKQDIKMLNERFGIATSHK